MARTPCKDTTTLTLVTTEMAASVTSMAPGASVAAVLREFLLAVERAKQPLDRAMQQFASADDAVLRAFADVHPQAEPLVHVWPDESGRGTRWENRDSIAAFLELVARLLRVTPRAHDAEALALKLIREKSASLEKLLTWSDKPLIEFRVLELMTTMARTGSVVARELVRVFSFQNAAFVKMTTRRLKKPATQTPEEKDEDMNDAQQANISARSTTPTAPAYQIRVAYIRLVLALTSCPDKSVHRFALKDGGVTSTLFKSLDGDDAETLALLLGELDALVLKNESLDRRGRAGVFNLAAVQQLVAVVKSEDESAAEHAWTMLGKLFFEPGALYHIPSRQSVRLFLVKTQQAGVTTGADIVADSTDSEPALENASWTVKVIRTAIAGIGLNDYVHSEYARQLVAKFISAYPGLLAEYLGILSPQLEPKLGYRWFCVASMMQRLLTCPLDAAVMDLQSSSSVSTEYTAQVVASRLILPLNIRKELSRGLQHSNNLVIYSSLAIVECALRRFAFVQSSLDRSSAISPLDLQNELRFLLPSPEALVSLLMKLCTKVDDAALVYVRALTVFRLYVEYLPQAMNEVKADFTKMLAWEYLDESLESTSSSTMRGVILGEVLRVLMVVDDSRLLFLVTSSSAGSSSLQGRSKLSQLLQLYVSTSSDAVRFLARGVLHRIFQTLKVFGVQPVSQDYRILGATSIEEINIWLDNMTTGGDDTAVFVELILQELVADPFSLLTATHQGGTESMSEHSRMHSPATKALASAFNTLGSERWLSNAKMDGVRHNPAVIAFGARVLLSILCTSADPTRFAQVVLGNHDGSCDYDQRSKKRRLSASVDLDKCDPIQCLHQFCRRFLSPTTSGPLSKERPTDFNWIRVQDRDFVSALFDTPPSMFINEVAGIADDIVNRAKSWQWAYHYIESRPDLDLISLIRVAATKAKSKIAAVLQNLVNGLPLHLYSQRLLFVLAKLGGDTSVDCDEVARLIEALRSRIASSQETHETAKVCEQILLCLRLSTAVGRDDVSAKLSDVLIRLQVVLSRISVLSDSTAVSRIERIRLKLGLMAQSTTSKKLVAADVCAQVLHSFKTQPGLAQIRYDGFSSSRTVVAAVLAASGPSELRLRVLHRLLSLGPIVRNGSIHGPLVIHLLKTLDGVTVPGVFEDKSALAKGIWQMLVTTSLDVDSTWSLYSCGLHVVGQLGGVDTADMQNTVHTKWVDVVYEGVTTASIGDFYKIVMFLKRVGAAICVSDRVTVSPRSAIVAQLVDGVLGKMTEDKASTVLLMVASAMYAMSNITPSGLLLAQAEAIATEHIRNVAEEGDLSTALRLVVLRRLALSGSGFDGLSQALNSLTVGTKKGLPFSTNQTLALLLAMRCTDLESIDFEALALVLLRSAIRLLDQNAKTGEDLVSTVDAIQFLVSEVETTLSKAGVQAVLSKARDDLMLLSTMGPPASEEAFIVFVKASASALTLLASEKSMQYHFVGYDVDLHLKIITQSKYFSVALRNTTVNVTLLRVVSALVRLGDRKYDRELFQQLLAAYSMSMSLADRTIRVLLDDFETHAGITAAQYGYRFGSSFTVTSLEQAGQARTDLQEDSSWLLNGGLDVNRVRATIEFFPLERPIAVGLADSDLLRITSPLEVINEPVGDEALVYDPSYLLPMLSRFVAASTLSDAVIIQNGVLGLAIRAISSNVEDAREHAYGILAHVHETLSGDLSDFKPGRQVHLLLDSLRNAVEDPLEVVSSVITVFLNDALSILCRPAHSMYPHLNHFFLARPAIDLNDVPMFYSLFNSRSPTTYKQERSWLLHNLRRGVREDADVSLLIRRHVPSILLSFFGSDLADEHTQLLVGSVLTAMLKTETGSSYLDTRCAFVEWLCARFDQVTATTSIALVGSLAEMFEHTLQVKLWSNVALHQRHSLAGAAVNTYESFLAATARRGVDRKLSRVQHIAQLVLEYAYSGCSLATFASIFESVRGSADALACSEKLVREHLVAHRDFQKSRFLDWAALIVDVVKVLVVELDACEQEAVTYERDPARAEDVLKRLRHILDSAPTLKLAVLGALRGNLAAYTLVL